MAKPDKHERSLVLVKPDGVQRGLTGQIISRFERKGLKLVGLKIMRLNAEDVKKHYGKYADKPFYKVIEDFMMSGPIVAMVWEGLEAVKACRLICGEKRHGFESEAGSIRGDFAISGGNNIVHSSDTPENATIEVDKFFDVTEIIDWDKSEYQHVYSPEDL
jgi:nucleoside-diphosphate kinase